MSVLLLVCFPRNFKIFFCFSPIFDSVQCMEQYKGPPGLVFFVDFAESDGNGHVFVVV